ncbi:hypothetical protein ACROYT_G000959 [Oculina patagonica]
MLPSDNMSSISNSPAKYDIIFYHEVNMLPSDNMSSISNSPAKYDIIFYHEVNMLPSDNKSSISNSPANYDIIIYHEVNMLPSDNMSSISNLPAKYDIIIYHEVNMLLSDNMSSISNSPPKYDIIIYHEVNMLPSDNMSSISNSPARAEVPKRPKLYISNLKLEGLIIVIISGSSSIFLFDSFGPEMNIRMNPRDGGFPKRPKMYFSSLKRAGFAGCEVKLSSYLRDGISTAGLIIVIISGSSSTFLFDSFGPEMNIRMNPRDGGFPKRPKMYFSSLKRAGFAGCEVKLSSYLRDGISTAGLIIVIISGSSSTFLFDSFGPEINIRMNPRDVGFPKRLKKYGPVLLDAK